MSPVAVFDSAAAASTEQLRAALVDHTLDGDADFRSDAQRQALAELVRRDADNAIVLPTGSGKSFLYMLMARMSRLGVTVVILPLVALLHDVVARCRRQQVPFTTWSDMNGGSTQPVMGADAPLVLATVEQAVQRSFCAWATRLQVAQQLHRIIVDEAHLLLTASSYRQVLLRLRDLRAVGCPWSIMSATLPNAGLHELGHLLLMPNIQYVRQSANRAELAYRVIQLGRNEGMAAAVKAVLRREQDKLVAVAPEAAAAWRAIVYCRSQRQCSELAGDMDAPCYDGSLSDEQRRRALDVWTTGTEARHRVIFATTAFGARVDCSGVRLVVHAGPSYSAMEFAQETGRAGRDGQPALCVALMAHS